MISQCSVEDLFTTSAEEGCTGSMYGGPWSRAGIFRMRSVRANLRKPACSSGFVVIVRAETRSDSRYGKEFLLFLWSSFPRVAILW
jgi:hypothetical protein